MRSLRFDLFDDFHGLFAGFLLSHGFLHQDGLNEPLIAVFQVARSDFRSLGDGFGRLRRPIRCANRLETVGVANAYVDELVASFDFSYLFVCDT